MDTATRNDHWRQFCADWVMSDIGDVFNKQTPALELASHPHQPLRRGDDCVLLFWQFNTFGEPLYQRCYHEACEECPVSSKERF